jgi:RND family efflux transporter MFP subunit
LFLLGVVLLTAACGDEAPATVEAVESPPVHVAVISAEPQSFTIAVPITGTLVSPSSVVVKAETVGKVLKFPKEEGDRVAAGEAVVWVDDSHENIALRQSESVVQVAEAALERARVLESHARSEFARAQNLLKSGGITDRDYKAAELADRDARAQVALAAAQLDQARAQVAASQKALDDSIMRSPVAGEIQAKLLSEGAYVEAPTPVFSVVDNSRLELESMVATADLGPIGPGQQVTFTVNAFPRDRFQGRVIEVNPAVETQTRSAKVRIRVNNSSRRLKAGMFVQGEIVTGVEHQAILIPTAAVYRSDSSAKRSHVFVVENGRAVRRNVRIGSERDSLLEIVEGLSSGDLIVAEQSLELAEGVRVTGEPRTGNNGT